MEKEKLEQLHALAMQMEDIISDFAECPDEIKESVHNLTFDIQEEIDEN